MLELTGATVIVTGAASGIGAATARSLYEAGARPVLAARRTDRLEELSAALGGALAVPTDVTDERQVGDLVRATVERYGRVDGLVNNAGVSLHHRMGDIDLEELRRVLDVNLVGVVAMTQAVLPVMREQGAGRIVNVGSGTTREPLPGTGGYAASKAALNMLTSVARRELEQEGITVSVVLPSITATEFNGGAYRPGVELRPGLVAHSPGYVARVILRALRTGEERIDIPHGAERPDLTAPPDGGR